MREREGPSAERWEGEGCSSGTLTRLRASPSGTLSRIAGEGLTGETARSSDQRFVTGGDRVPAQAALGRERATGPKSPPSVVPQHRAPSAGKNLPAGTATPR